MIQEPAVCYFKFQESATIGRFWYYYMMQEKLFQGLRCLQKQSEEKKFQFKLKSNSGKPTGSGVSVQ